MNALRKIAQEVKENILKDYLSGMKVHDIAKKYGFRHDRTVYFHLKPLSKEDKAMHKKNFLIRAKDS